MHHILTQFSEDAKLLRKGVADHTGERTNNTDGDDNKNVSVMKMKIVLSKQKLEKLLQGGSFHEMVYQTLEKQTFLSDDNNLQCNTSWRPMLDSIAES
uniref:Uncharacterized protein n=1 Tax=Brassica oleracea TaxID=3712 RepID=A0A3P6GTV7_BRAOL|nr:unnamed protein product [Brassica oleracea]